MSIFQRLHEYSGPTGITPIEVEASLDAFYDVLADGNFDVLHIACHAESPHRTIDRASLIIGDETSPGTNQPRLIEIDSTCQLHKSSG